MDAMGKADRGAMLRMMRDVSSSSGFDAYAARLLSEADAAFAKEA